MHYKNTEYFIFCRFFSTENKKFLKRYLFERRIFYKTPLNLRIDCYYESGLENIFKGKVTGFFPRTIKY